MILSQWESKEGCTTYYLVMEEAQVVVGETTGNPHTEAAGTCSHADFVADARRWHRMIEERFGAAVLTDAIRIAKLQAASQEAARKGGSGGAGEG